MTMLTRKDYKAIAAIVCWTGKIASKKDRQMMLIGSLADYMATDNPKFDWEMFVRACGYDHVKAHD